MKQVALHLQDIVNRSIPLLMAIPEKDASRKPAPGKWSKKEIIGHLIDSACNNHQKFVRTIQEEELHFVGYEQDSWVALQAYNTEPWEVLVHLLERYNLHLAHVIDNIPQEALNHSIYINETGPYSLEFIVKDYPEHLKHHLHAVLPYTTFLENTFRMVY